MIKFLRRLLKRLPVKYVKTVKKVYYKFKINRDTFKSQEKEFSIIKELINQGDWVLDIGANVGHYTLEFSKLVGTKGRVLAFEPIPETFDLLVSNVGHVSPGNTTLINGAISTEIAQVNFTIPRNNLYLSHMDADGDISVMAFPLKNFLPDEINLAFIKIDAEGYDEIIVSSIYDVVDRFRPIIMAEIGHKTATSLVLEMKDYCVMSIEGSHNKFLVPEEIRYRVNF